VLCGLCLFLIAYVGADLGDRVITDLAGVFGLGVAFFPTTPTVASPASARCETVSHLSSQQQVIGDVHAVCGGRGGHELGTLSVMGQWAGD
jgi:hypothetical protein